MIFQKRVSVGGEFLKKRVDYEENDVLTIANKGQQIPSQTYTNKDGSPKVQNIFLMKLLSGKEGNVNFNGRTIDNLIEGYGKPNPQTGIKELDGNDLVGKQVKVFTMMQDVGGKIMKVYYFFHPDTVFNEATDEFVIRKNDKPQEPDIETVNQEIEQSTPPPYDDPFEQIEADHEE